MTTFFFVLMVQMVFSDKPPMKIEGAFPSHKVCMYEGQKFLNEYDSDNLVGARMQCVKAEPDTSRPKPEERDAEERVD